MDDQDCSTEIDDMIHKSTDLLLARTLSNCLQNVIKRRNVGLTEDARHTAEEEIYTNLNQKIDQFLQLADYDWMAAQGSGEASDYLSDLIAFLCSTFTVFTHLPGEVAQTACMSACKHLSTSLLQLLLESEVKQISMGALQQFNIDVKKCECKYCPSVPTSPEL
ncbi:UNVERIFIED_CONTAM: hypothetical protein FKN15_041885 [Acipenser sinensis]